MRDATAFRPERLRVATLDEVARYGQTGLRSRKLLPPIGGGAGYARVGALGTVASGASTVTPAYGQAPTAGNLLICWASPQASGAALSTASAGWAQVTGGGNIFWKIAAGGDAAPTITSTVGIYAQLGEFSGNATTSPLDSRNIGTTNTSTTLVVVNIATDVAAGELVIFSSGTIYSTTTTRTLSNALNNGATATSTTNSGASSASFYNFGYGVTTSNAGADTDTLTISTTTKLTLATLSTASFKLPPVATLPAGKARHRTPPAHYRSPSRGRF